MANKGTSRKASKKTAAKKKTAKASAAKKLIARPAKKAAKKAVKRSAKKSFGSSRASRKSSPPSIADQLRVQQSSEYVRRNWWNWSVWIEAPSTVLDDIEYVDYMLHSSFKNPLRRHTNRHEKFMLKSAGWGEFMIVVVVKPKNGNAFARNHFLTLDYPEPPKTVKRSTFSIKEEKRRPNVFLSAGVSDLTMSNTLAQALRQRNINVLKADELSTDLPWDVAIGEIVKNADLMVVLLSGRPTSSTMREIYSAKDRKSPLPIVPITIGPDAMVPDELEDVEPINLTDPTADGIAGDVVTQVIDRIKKLPLKT